MIDSFLSSFISILTSGFTTFFNTLDSISFAGITLLDFIISIFLIGTVVPLILTTLRSRRNYGGRSKSERRKNNEE